MENYAGLNKFIPLARPNIIKEDIDAVVKVLESGMLVQGKNVLQLETDFCSYTNSLYSSALSNGTATLHLALIASGIMPGDEVIVPAFSYIATANVIELIGATPVFVDIDLRTFNIDITKIEAAITKKTRAIIPVHEFGLSCEIEYLVKIAEKYKLIVIEDAACALGAEYNGKHVGSFGHFGSFSLHPRKAISSGEGGVLVTNTESYDKKIKVLRNHGVDTVIGTADFSEFGFNYRMTDFQAALVVSQMKRLRETLVYKNELAQIYFSEIKSQHVTLPFIPENTKPTWQTYHILVSDEIDRDKLMDQFKKNNVGVNYGAQCIPYMNSYQKKYKHNCELLFPNAMRAYKKGIALPLYELLKREDLTYISYTLNKLTNDKK